MGVFKETGYAAAGWRCAEARPERTPATNSMQSENDEERIASLPEMYKTVRARTMEIVAPLEIEDYVVQTAPYMSPPRWHLGHTTWFFEMVLKDFAEGYQVQSENYLYYFNSYYERYGSRIEKGSRGTRSRPTVRETLEYRRRIDERMEAWLRSMDVDERSAEILRLVRLGLEHEMQHQELMVYDIKHLLGDLYRPSRTTPLTDVGGCEATSGMAEIEEGLFELGHGGGGFAYDNEKPRHLVYLQDYRIGRAAVTNGEYLEFVKAGGYRDYSWWHSEGWAALHKEGWEAPLYWECVDGEWMVR